MNPVGQELQGIEYCHKAAVSVTPFDGSNIYNFNIVTKKIEDRIIII